jgi:pyruvate,orthophosphate dikinase
MPEAFAELIAIFDRLEKHYRDMQDLEFTIEDGKLWMLQTRSGKRTAQGRRSRSPWTWRKKG